MVFTLLFYGCLMLPAYILTGWGLYSIAGRRGLRWPWLAWVPGGHIYLLGCVSDQYQAMVRGKNRNKRTVLLVLILGELAAFGICGFLAPMAQTGTMLPFLLTFLSAWCAMAALIVVGFLSLYDLYRSCDPGNGVLFLILSMVFGVSVPILLFLCRNKDLGFPL